MPSPGMERPGYFGLSRKVWIGTAVSILLFPLILIEDGRIQTVFKDLRVPVLFHLMRIVTWLGVGWILAVPAAALFGIGQWRKKPRLKQAAALSLMALAVSGLVVQTIKHLVGRPRPKLVDQGIMTWGPSLKSGHDSFPSGHTISAFAMAAVLSSFFPAGRWIWYSLAFLVGFTRVYIGAHFASDVLAGAVLGILIGIWASRLNLKWLKS